MQCCMRLKAIKAGAFWTRMLLKIIFLPLTVSRVRVTVFQRYLSLVYVQLAEGLTTVAPFVFGNCYLLEEIFIPTAVTWIRELAFHGCNNMKTVIFYGAIALQLINKRAFERCSSLKSISIPSVLTK